MRLEGGCGCRAVRYQMEGPPLVVHACHCRWCQRETGSAFALNAMIEADRITILGVEPERREDFKRWDVEAAQPPEFLSTSNSTCWPSDSDLKPLA